MRYFFVAIFLAFIFILSCRDKSQSTESINIEELKIKIDYPFLPSYSTISFLKKGDDIFLGGYNHKMHSFDFINLSNANLHENFSVELHRDGPDQVIGAGTFCFTDEYIVVNDVQNMLFLSYQGKVIKKIGIDSLFDSSGLKGFTRKSSGATLANYLSMKYNEKTDNIIVPTIPPVNFKEEISHCNIGVRININNFNNELTPCKYPSDLNSTFFSYGGLIIPYVNDYPDRYVYNFPYSSEIYVYFKKDKQLQTIKLNSSHIKNKAAPMHSGMNPKEKLENEFKSQRFREVYYSPDLKKYFRIHHSEKEKISNDKSSKSYLMVYDERNKSQREYVLPDDANYQYIIADNLLFIVCKEVRDENEMRLLKINLADIRIN